MKIVIAIDHFREGGAERVASVLINQLCKEQHEVHVVVMEKDINYPIAISGGNFHVMHFQRGNRIVRKLTKLLSYRKIIREIKSDVIFAFGNFMAVYTVMAALGENAKIISSERTDPTHEPSNPISKMLRNWAYDHSEVLICQTDWVKQYFERRLKTDCLVIPNPITPNLPEWKGQDSHQILTACRLTAQKNLPLLIRAFERFYHEYPSYTLKILGEGELRPKLENLVRELGLKESVLMPGFSKNVHEEMVHSKMYVSSSDYEGISNSMLEALGCGLPVIHTDCPVGGASMFIRHDVNGILVPVGDEIALYQAMLKIASNNSYALSLSSSSRKINDILSVDKISISWLSLLK